jgi:hypothetical protein
MMKKMGLGQITRTIEDSSGSPKNVNTNECVGSPLLNI